MTPADWSALSAALAYSLAGFAVGYFVGKAGREIHEVREAVVTIHGTTTRVRSDPLGWVHSRPFGVILVILAVLTVSVSGYTLQKQGRVIDCQTRYNEAYAQALGERTKAAGADRDATRKMVATIAGLGNVPAEQRREVYRHALSEFLDGSQKADAQRQANPLPSPRCP